MNPRKITILIVFALYLLDKHIDRINGTEINYSAWIVIFLFWIAYNTSKLEDK